MEHAKDMKADLGPANKARPSAIEAVGGDARVRGGIRAAAIHARVFHDATLFDRMHHFGQLSDRQRDASYRLSVLWSAAGLNPRVSADYRALPTEIFDDDMPESAPDDDEDATTPLDRYRRLMREMPRVFVERVEAMLLGQHPGSGRLEVLQDGLDWLGDRWGLEKVLTEVTR